MNDTKITNCNQLFDKIINIIDFKNFQQQVTSNQFESHERGKKQRYKHSEVMANRLVITMNKFGHIISLVCAK